MAKKYVTSNEFGKAMLEMLNDYGDEIYDDVEQTSKDIASKALTINALPIITILMIHPK